MTCRDLGVVVAVAVFSPETESVPGKPLVASGGPEKRHEQRPRDMDWPSNDLYRWKTFISILRRPTPLRRPLISGFLVPGFLA